MFRVYKKIKNKIEKQNPTVLIKTIKNKNKENKNNIMEKIIYKLKINKKNGINLILSKQINEENILPEELNKLINILFKMWIEISDNLIFKALKKLLRFNQVNLIKKDIFNLFKIVIQMKKMTDEFYELFFKICIEDILEHKNELRELIHSDYLNRLCLSNLL